MMQDIATIILALITMATIIIIYSPITMRYVWAIQTATSAIYLCYPIIALLFIILFGHCFAGGWLHGIEYYTFTIVSTLNLATLACFIISHYCHSSKRHNKWESIAYKLMAISIVCGILGIMTFIVCDVRIDRVEGILTI
jgi:hypothetical protein